MRILIRFFGSVHFSIALFCTSALVVAAVTLIDLPQRQQNGLFSVLICGFLLNLFVSLCSRYPFQKSHLPFVLAHCGLLLIFGGAFVKGLLGFEGIFLVTKESSHREIVLDGHRESALLLPFKRACEKAGYPYLEMLPLWFSEWKSGHETIYAKEALLPVPLQHVMESFDWDALPLSFQNGALRLSQFLEARQNRQIGKGLAKEVFYNGHAPLLFISEWTALLKAHLYTCCLFVEGMQCPPVQLKLKEIPYSASLVNADEANHICHVALTDADGRLKDIAVGLNSPYDTADGYRFTLREIAPSNRQVQLLVSWDPTSSFWMAAGAALTGLGIILLFVQKMRGKHVP
jgi:hypothetical protein